MIEIGKYNILTINEKAPHGLYLTDENGEEVLLPNRYVPENVKIGEQLEVFIYNDSEDRIIATTEAPIAEVNQFAVLEVKELTPIGAFVDIGLPKDLLIPIKNQDKKLAPGKKYLFYTYLDRTTERLVGTTRYRAFINKEPSDLKSGDQVDLIIAEPHDLGFVIIINNQYQGLIYKDEIFQNINVGDKTVGYVKNIRPDGKIDISLEKPGYAKVAPGVEVILSELHENNGFLPLTDKSSPEEISDRLSMSKKTFKKAVGSLYKERKIQLTDEGIRLSK